MAEGRAADHRAGRQGLDRAGVDALPERHRPEGQCGAAEGAGRSLWRARYAEQRDRLPLLPGVRACRLQRARSAQRVPDACGPPEVRGAAVWRDAEESVRNLVGQIALPESTSALLP